MTLRAQSFATDGTAQDAARALIDGARRAFGPDGPRLLFVFASTAQPLGALAGALREALPKTTILSASTAGEFTERGDRKSGVAALALHCDDDEFVCSGGIATGLSSDPDVAVARALEGQPLSVEGYPHQTAVLLLDPLAGHAEEAALLLATRLGESARIAGGAAGDDLAMKLTHVGYNGVVSSDAAVVALVHSKHPIGIGVKHGHRSFTEPFTITSASGSLVRSIEGEPAWPFWRELVRDEAKRAGYDVDVLDPSKLGALLLQFEGALDVGSELKVRAPLALEGDAIRFACEIPEGARLRITQSSAEAQVASALEAARLAKGQLGDAKVAGAVVFDCICRNLILGAQFDAAVKGISTALDGAPIAGFETYGEIALVEGDLSGFHNTTSVVLAFGAKDG